MRKKSFSILLIILILLSCVNSKVFAKSYNSKITEAELKSDIEACFNWAKMGNDILLNDEFLNYVGMTDGDWFPINMGRYGYQENTFNLYLDAIEKDITQKYQSSSKLDRNKATEWHRIALAVTSMGGDPTNIGKDVNGNPINLIADGTYNCVLSKVDRQGINGPIWALISADSMNYEIPSNVKYQREDLIVMILERQMSDGGFTLGGTATRDLPSDPDITAMALQALAPYKDSTTKYTAHGGVQKTIGQVIEESLAQMSKIQKEDGDFSSWGTVNVESTAQMLVALTALGIDPYQDTRFIKNGNTLIDGILKYQLSSGGFTHSFTHDPQNPDATAGEENRMASEQAALGLISYYRFTNEMTRLYDFTDMIEIVPTPTPTPAPVTSGLSWIILENVRLSGIENEKFVAVFDEDINSYTIKVPYGFSEIKVHETPFDESTQTNLKKGTVINCNQVNDFYYINEKGEKVDFDIKCDFHYYAEPESIILETKCLADFDFDSNTKYIGNKKVIELKTRFENLEFSYEKCYITAQIDFYKLIQDIKVKLNNVVDETPSPQPSTNPDITPTPSTNPDITPTPSTTPDITTTPSTTPKPTSKPDNNGGSSGYYEYEEHETTVVTTKTFDDVIPHEEFEAIMGLDENVKGTSTIGDTDKKCTFIFNGQDVSVPMDFVVKVNNDSEYKNEIQTLSPNAYIFSFEYQYDFPGKALLELETDLADGKYILFTYNTTKKQAEVLEKIEVLDGITKFIIEKNATYFIAKEASLESLVETNAKIEDSETEVNIKKSEDNQINLMLIFGIVFIILALILAVILTVVLIKRKKDEEESEIEIIEDENIEETEF